jgi:hypothetical protein
MELVVSLDIEVWKRVLKALLTSQSIAPAVSPVEMAGHTNRSPWVVLLPASSPKAGKVKDAAIPTRITRTRRLQLNNIGSSCRDDNVA